WRSGESTWSDGWAEWPGEEAERTEVTRPAPAPAPAPAPKREAKRKSLPIAVKPSPPPTERVDRGIGADITEPRSTARRRARRPAARAATPAGLATSLRDHRQLRRAIVLKEVLGPPLSLRTNEDRTDLG